MQGEHHISAAIMSRANYTLSFGGGMADSNLYRLQSAMASDFVVVTLTADDLLVR